MFPRAWTVTVDGQEMTVVAGTSEAAERIAAQRIRRQRISERSR